MPLYEYRCVSCGKTTEVLQRLAEAPLSTCPHCAGVLVKQVSAPALQFKGSGWYVTDYAKSSAPGGAPAEGATTPAADTPAEAPAAPATKPATKPATEAPKEAKAAPTTSTPA